MLSLWTRFRALYGSQWEKNYGEVGGTTFNEWKGALAQFTPEQVRRGLQAVVEEGSEYVPNLIKFLRLCRTAYPYEENLSAPKLDKPKPRYSVYRIETAKQQLLTGEQFHIPKGHKNKMVIDWTRADEEELQDLILQWEPETGLIGLNALIDGHEFSHGRQEDNAYEF